jgi:hypothetical protein
MNIGIFGSGTVARVLGGRLLELGHNVLISSRDPSATKDRGSHRLLISAEEWANVEMRKLPGGARAGSFGDAAVFGQLLVNATAGKASLEALGEAVPADMEGKILIDVANPLDWSSGELRLVYCNTESLGERIQEAFPGARVVKTFNTVNVNVMVDPGLLPEQTDMFVAGNDGVAKAWVMEDFLKGWFGWQRVVDLGDITGARAMEMYLPLWVRLRGAADSGLLNVKVVQTQG